MYFFKIRSCVFEDEANMQQDKFAYRLIASQAFIVNLKCDILLYSFYTFQYIQATSSFNLFSQTLSKQP